MTNGKRCRPTAEITAPINPDKLYNTAEAADLLGVSYATIERWRQLGVGPVVTRLYEGATPRYRGSDLLAAMDAGRETQTGTAA